MEEELQFPDASGSDNAEVLSQWWTAPKMTDKRHEEVLTDRWILFVVDGTENHNQNRDMRFGRRWDVQ